MFARPVTALAAVSLVVGCAGDGPVVYTDDVVPSPTTVPVFTTVPGTEPVVVEQLWSPAAATVRVFGTGALATDLVSVDGDRVEPVSFATNDDGTFEIELTVDRSGELTVCVRDECGRVFVQPA